jgi:twinkle protein
MKQYIDYGIEIPNHESNGNIKAKCPRCIDGRRNKSDKSLSVNLDKGIWNCHYCGWSGTINEKEEKPVYNLPKQNNNPLPESGMKWFESRGISKNTIQRFKITGVEGKIDFNFYRDGKLIYVKHRTYPDKRFSAEAGCEVIPYNQDALKDDQEGVVITEGEMDTLSVYESSPNTPCISVPNGAQGTTWIDSCFDLIDKKEDIVLALDGDEKGEKYLNELSRRLGRFRCRYVDYPEGTKDLNEVLLKYGREKVHEVLESAKSFPLEGIVSPDVYRDEVYGYVNNGFPKGDRCGMVWLDPLISFKPGELFTGTGTPGSGKSEVVDEIMMRLSSRSKKDETRYYWRWGIVSFENQPVSFHVVKLISKYHRKAFVHCTKDEVREAMDFIDEHFFFINLTDNDLTIDGLLEKGKELVMRRGIIGFVIDPYNYIEHKYSSHMSETNYISEFLTKVAAFCKSYQVLTIIIAHPRKIEKDPNTGNFKVPSLYDVNGSANWYNKTDNGFTVWRDFHSDEVQIHIQKVRFKWIGQQGWCSLRYDKLTGCYKSEENSLGVKVTLDKVNEGTEFELKDFSEPQFHKSDDLIQLDKNPF